MTPDIIALVDRCLHIVNRITSDAGGGCPLSKSFVTAWLALEFDLKTYVEIGVYRGRSFFPVAHVVSGLGGMAYGIDPYETVTASEHDLPPDIAEAVSAFVASLDYRAVAESVDRLRDEFGVAAATRIIPHPSAAAIALLRQEQIVIDLLHIDGNHDTQAVSQDVALYVPLVRTGGFVVVDDVDLPSVRPVFNQLKRDLDLVYTDGQFAILLKGDGSRVSVAQRRRLAMLHTLVDNLEKPAAPAAAKVVSVVVLARNQESYIAECVEGILGQRCDYRLEVIVGDDCSTDATATVIRRYLGYFNRPDRPVTYLTNDTRLGVAHNLRRCLDACTGEYIAICAGDDYWTDPDKLQLQIDQLTRHPECALSFHDIEFLFQENGDVEPFDLQRASDAATCTTRTIIRHDLSGSFSCCVYRARSVRAVPAALFDLPVNAWILNIFCSLSGDVGRVRRTMSIYRKHAAGTRSRLSRSQQAAALHRAIDGYNRLLNYDFDAEFCDMQRRLARRAVDGLCVEPWDLAIFDDLFPNRLAAFRQQEFDSYLETFARVKVYTTGGSAHLLGSETIDESIAAFKRLRPAHASQIERLSADSIVHARLIYVVFLGNAYRHIDSIEQLNIPFVFALYPGGSFALNNPRSDARLRRVVSSPCFRRVIVTQEITRRYLLTHGFCRPEQIEFVYGMVAPIDRMAGSHAEKRRFGIDKPVLDICFVAFKYTVRGVDKGYDLFVDVARALCARRDDVRFHVVGGFDEGDIDVRDIRDRLVFYGPRPTDWFDEFYRDKDLILSPNRPSMIVEGNFDGFPPGGGIDAALRGTAMFASDPLGLSTHFIDGEHVVLIPLDVQGILGLLEHYASHPVALARIGEAGGRRVRELFSLAAQMPPRVELLRAEMQASSPRPAGVESIRIAPAGPRLLRADYFGYNIVGYLNRVWGVPLSLGPIDLAATDVGARVPAGVLIDESQARIEGTIRALRSPEPLAALVDPRTRPAAPPRLVASDQRGFNIVSYSGRFWALPQSLGPVDLATADVDALLAKGVIVDQTMTSLTTRLELT